MSPWRELTHELPRSHSEPWTRASNYFGIPFSYPIVLATLIKLYSPSPLVNLAHFARHNICRFLERLCRRNAEAQVLAITKDGFTTQESTNLAASFATSRYCSALAEPIKIKQDDLGLMLEDLGNQRTIAPGVATRRRTQQNVVSVKINVYKAASTILTVPKYSVRVVPTNGAKRSTYHSSIELQS
ncbi:hypothetical protein BDZ45DRAFT_687998 [Acephala macrosclerotiorum]|nr:hypothetical protein BDZ45DRAFT_687998 [Acephala macrosclerotiorum]